MAAPVGIFIEGGAFCPECKTRGKNTRKVERVESVICRLHTCPACGITFRTIQDTFRERTRD